jgi:hypothetical protein
MTLLRRGCGGQYAALCRGAATLNSAFCLFHGCPEKLRKTGEAEKYLTTKNPARPAATEEIQPRINTDGHGSEVIAHPCPSVSIRGKNSSLKCTTLNYCVTEITEKNSFFGPSLCALCDTTVQNHSFFGRFFMRRALSVVQHRLGGPSATR